MLNTSTLTRIARLTRGPAQNIPFATRFLLWIVKLFSPRKSCSTSYRLVAEYDEGLINIDTSSFIEYEILFRGYYQPTLSELIKRSVRLGNVCLDVGANVGAYTLLMAFAAGKDGRIVALEPHPDIAARLRANIALNNLDNVDVIEAALSDEDGKATFYVHGNDAFNRGGSGLTSSEVASKPIEVAAVTGASLEKTADIGRLDFIKIDVEGSEMMALRELSELIGRHRPYLIFEHQKTLWYKSGSTIEEALELLSPNDYDLYTLQANVFRSLGHTVPANSDIFCAPRQK